MDGCGIGRKHLHAAPLPSEHVMLGIARARPISSFMNTAAICATRCAKRQQSKQGTSHTVLQLSWLFAFTTYLFVLGGECRQLARDAMQLCKVILCEDANDTKTSDSVLLLWDDSERICEATPFTILIVTSFLSEAENNSYFVSHLHPLCISLGTSIMILVTGASGFIASHIVRELLERGYTVRGTVRNVADLTKTYFLSALSGAQERLTLVEADLMLGGSFVAAAEGCDAVTHTASPCLVNVDNPQSDLVDPALQGTLNVLRAAAKANVRRVVLTSSMAAISDEPHATKVFTENDWNERSTLDRNPYYLSKVKAEKAAWNFVKSTSPSFDMVVINPYLVLGPSLGPDLNTTNAIFRDLLSGTYPGILDLSWGLVDVRDVAKAHVLAMENPNASGRYLCAGETFSMKQVVEVLRHAGYAKWTLLPKRDLSSRFFTWIMKILSYTQPKGTGSYLRTHLGRVMLYDTSKIQRDLGMVYRSAKDSVLDTVADLKLRGHVIVKQRD